MKILFSSYAFRPSVGGIETVSAILAKEFVAAGHEVLLVTEAPGDVGGENYSVVRCPSLRKLVDLIRWSDIIFQNNISLRSLIPALLLLKRALVVHQTWMQNVCGEIGWNDRIKRALLPLVTNISISQAVADRLGTRSVVIGNPYDDSIFRLSPNVVRDKTIVFVGRLVSDKGADLLLQAVKLLQSDELTPDLTVIGTGPEEQNLRRLTYELGLERQVTFVGVKTGGPLAQLLNRHRILAVPSRWAEPFGVVALEGIACGCVVVGSQEGGLKEAIGPCGLVFENGNHSALAECLKKILAHPDPATEFCYPAPAHLERFKARTVAAAYSELFGRAAP